jgi:tetratricopeptide (TPR) repeat protein
MTVAKASWTKFPHADKAYTYAGEALKKGWARLHRGDCEPFPKDEAAQEAWRLFHAGEFERAAATGVEAGESGLVAANKATCIYAAYLEKAEAKKLKLFEDAAVRAEGAIKANAKNPNAHYCYAFALGRYAQGISITKALAQGIGGKVKDALTQVIKLEPKHADAHIALGTYHAEIIDKVGAMVGGLTYGAKKETAVELFERALKLNPESAIARIEYANGLVMMYGKAKMKEAEKLYKDAAACKPVDAMERLDVELAKENLED